MAMLGTFILAFGCSASTPAPRSGTDSLIAVIAVNTMLAGSAGAVVAMLYVWKLYGKPDP